MRLIEGAWEGSGMLAGLADEDSRPRRRGFFVNFSCFVENSFV